MTSTGIEKEGQWELQIYETLLSSIRLDRNKGCDLDKISGKIHSLFTGRGIAIEVGRFISEVLANGLEFPEIVKPVDTSAVAGDDEDGTPQFTAWAKAIVHTTQPRIMNEAFPEDEQILRDYRIVWWVWVDEAKKKQVIRIFGMLEKI